MPQLYTKTLGTGPDLVLLHGWGMDSMIWRPVLPVLTKNYRVTCIDLPGYGLSPEVDGSIERVIDSLLSVAPTRACWVGWSLGGMLAILVANKCPERVSALLIVATNLCFTRSASWPTAMPKESLLSLAKALEHDPSAALRRFIALQFLGVSIDKKLIKQLQAEVCAGEVSLNTLRHGLGLLSQLDLRDVFKTLQSPVQAVFGRFDKLVPVEAAAAIKALNSAVRISIFTQAGHAPFISHPCRFIEQVNLIARR